VDARILRSIGARTSVCRICGESRRSRLTLPAYAGDGGAPGTPFSLSRFQDAENGVFLNRLASLDVDFFDNTAVGCDDLVFHFHRFQNTQALTVFHVNTGLDSHGFD